MMPDMDGWDTINEIVNSGHIKDVAISVITGKGTKDFQKMSMLGSYIMDYLTKPVDINVLIKSLERSIKYLNSKNKE
jgi:DNA-binding response OmpR family regulator